MKNSNSINNANAKVSNAFATPKSGNFQNNSAKTLNSNSASQNNTANAKNTTPTDNLENEADEFDQFDGTS